MRRRERTGWGPRRLKGVVGDGGAGAPSLLYDVPPLNLPPGSFSEGAAIKGVNRCRIREIIASLNRQVRWGKLRRVVIAGMPYYCPTKTEYNHRDNRSKLTETTQFVQDRDQTDVTTGEDP